MLKITMILCLVKCLAVSAAWQPQEKSNFPTGNLHDQMMPPHSKVLLKDEKNEKEDNEVVDNSRRTIGGLNNLPQTLQLVKDTVLPILKKLLQEFLKRLFEIMDLNVCHSIAKKSIPDKKQIMLLPTYFDMLKALQDIPQM